MEAWYPSRHLRHSGVFIVNFEHISHLVLVLLLVTLNMQLPAGMCIILSRVTFQNEQPCFSKKKNQNLFTSTFNPQVRVHGKKH